MIVVANCTNAPRLWRMARSSHAPIEPEKVAVLAARDIVQEWQNYLTLDNITQM